MPVSEIFGIMKKFKPKQANFVRIQIQTIQLLLVQNKERALCWKCGGIELVKIYL